MGKISKTMSFKNAVLDLSDLSLTEVNKDDEQIYNIMDILKEWDKVSGISLTIKQDSDFVAEDGEET